MVDEAEAEAEAAAPPRANITRHRAKYSSSVVGLMSKVGLSKRGRLERLRLAHDSREWRLGCS